MYLIYLKKKSHHPTVVLWAQAAVLLQQCF